MNTTEAGPTQCNPRAADNYPRQEENHENFPLPEIISASFRCTAWRKSLRYDWLKLQARRVFGARASVFRSRTCPWNGHGLNKLLVWRRKESLGSPFAIECGPPRLCDFWGIMHYVSCQTSFISFHASGRRPSWSRNGHGLNHIFSVEWISEHIP